MSRSKLKCLSVRRTFDLNGVETPLTDKNGQPYLVAMFVPLETMLVPFEGGYIAVEDTSMCYSENDATKRLVFAKDKINVKEGGTVYGKIERFETSGKYPIANKETGKTYMADHVTCAALGNENPEDVANNILRDHKGITVIKNDGSGLITVRKEVKVAVAAGEDLAPKDAKTAKTT